jgi:uncharacterized protein with HEPN domain
LTSSQNAQFVAHRLISITDKEVRYFEKTLIRLKATNINLEWVKSLEEMDHNSELLDAFVSRFSRLQDTLGDKLLPTVLRLHLEPIGSQIDNLLRAEKLGWIASLQSWVELRELRNRLVHEYMETPEALLEAIHQALLTAHLLIETQIKLKSRVTAA